MYKVTKIFLSLPLVRQEWVEEKTSSMIPELLSQFTLLAFPSQSILSFDVKSCWARFDENLAVRCSKQHNFLTWFSRLMDWPQKLCASCPVYSIKKWRIDKSRSATKRLKNTIRVKNSKCSDCILQTPYIKCQSSQLEVCLKLLSSQLTFIVL